MKWYEQLIIWGTLLLTPVCLVYAWWYYIARLREYRREWRSVISVVAVGLISVTIISWPIMLACSPVPNAFGSNYGIVYHYLRAWYKPIFRILALALVLGFFARPRLIAPIAISVVGVGMFWIFSTEL